MNQVMNGEPMTVFGDGTQTRAFSYITDVAPVIGKSIEVEQASGRTFNIGADTPYSVLRLGSVIAHAMGVEPEFEFLPPRNEVKHAFSDHQAVSQVFGHRDPVTLEVGVGRMAEWAQRVGPRPTQKFKGVEIEKDLPEIWADAMED